ncbi:UNVERIFIED_CONTAM: hypothetical protein HDU68_008307 [Siphonaria sp. JEL0065]|nr:hypothetical protein HDU68_008307 [Siphonaria sp. JEL0065]
MSVSGRVSTSSYQDGDPIPHGEELAKMAKTGRYAVFGGSYMLIKTIGQGEFGKVKMGIQIETNKQVAVKLTKKALLGPDRRERLMREISILQSLDHPYILKLHDVIETDNYIGMIMEPCLGGELFEYIVRRNYLVEKDAVRFFAQIVTGVSYLHSVGIVHRDLKLENILLDSDQNICIADFGFASQATRNDSNLLETSCGSPAYAAPELVLNDKYQGVAADIWSCGIILYSMLAGYLPFDDDPTNPDGSNIHLLYKYIMRSKPDYPDNLTEEAKDLIGIMLITDPLKRAKMADVMGHKWLAPAISVFEFELVRRRKLLGISGVDSSAPIESVGIPETIANVPASSVEDVVMGEANAVEGMVSVEIIPEYAHVEPLDTISALMAVTSVPSSVTGGGVAESVEAVVQETRVPTPGDIMPIQDVEMADAGLSAIQEEETEDVASVVSTAPHDPPVEFPDMIATPAVKWAKTPEPVRRKAPSPVQLTPPPPPPVTVPRISKSDEGITMDMASNSRLEWLFKRTKTFNSVAGSNSEKQTRVTQDTKSEYGASIASATTSGAAPSLLLTTTNRQKSRPQSMAFPDPSETHSLGGRSGTLGQGRASTNVSISASDYHLRYMKTPPQRHLKFHQRGAIDKRALSSRDLESLFMDLEHALLDKGMEISSTGEKTGEYKFTVVQPGMMISGNETTNGTGGRVRGVSVDLKQLAKKGGDLARLGSSLESVDSVRLESSVSKAVNKEVKSAKTQIGSGFLPAWISKKWQYLQSYGFNYNKGFDGKSVRSTGSVVSGNVQGSPTLSTLRESSSSSDSVVSVPVQQKQQQQQQQQQQPRAVRFVDEITFNVEIFKLKNLPDMYVVEFKRVRGNIWEFKNLYNRIITDLPLNNEY